MTDKATRQHLVGALRTATVGFVALLTTIAGLSAGFSTPASASALSGAHAARTTVIKSGTSAGAGAVAYSSSDAAYQTVVCSAAPARAPDQQPDQNSASAPIFRFVVEFDPVRPLPTSSGQGNYDPGPAHEPGGLVNRYYDPTTGEFMTVDPDLAETDQPYQYAGGDPVNDSDPAGLVTAPFPNASDCVQDNSSSVCPIGTALNGSPIYAPDVCQNIVAFDIGSSSVATECPTGGSVSFDQALMSGLDSFNHSGLNPAYDFLTSVRNEVDVDEDPCSTGWDEFLAGANVVASTVSLGLVAAGPLADGAGGAEAVEQWASRGDAGAITPPALTPWGWTGSGSYRTAVDLVDQGGDVTDVLGTIPTQAQARQLIEDGGGTIVRDEEPAHLPPNPHQYPHINYLTSNGEKGTIQTAG